MKINKKITTKISLGVLSAFLLFTAFLSPNSVSAVDQAGGHTFEVKFDRKMVSTATGVGAAPAMVTEYTFTAYLDGNKVNPSTCDCSLSWVSDIDGAITVNNDTGQAVYKDSGYYPGKTYPRVRGVLKLNSGGPELTDSKHPTEDSASNTTATTEIPANEALEGSGDTLVAFLAQVIQVIVNMITAFLQWITTKLITPLIITLLAFNPHEAAFSAVILNGWVLVRNLMNILFIVALIVIGLATLFRVDSYNYRTLLVKLIINALLINFSLVFARLVLGVADTVQAQFLPQSADVMNSLTHQLIVAPNLNMFNVDFTGTFQHVISSITLLVFAIGAFFALASIVAYLLIRTVALWVLLLTSPFAYGLRILPSTASYAKKWWNEFLKYAFFTPILGFFLTIAAVLGDAQSRYITSVVNSNSTGSLGQFISIALTNILLIIFLYVGVKIANSSVTYGAKAVSGWAEKMTRTTAGYLTTKPAAYVAGDIANRAKEAKDLAVRRLNEGAAQTYNDKNASARAKVGAALSMTAARTLAPMSAYKAYSGNIAARRKANAELADLSMKRTEGVMRSGGIQDLEEDKDKIEQIEKSKGSQYSTKSTAELAEALKAMGENSYYQDTNEGRTEKRALLRQIYDKGALSKVMETYNDPITGEAYKYNFGTAMEFLQTQMAADPELERFRDSLNDMGKEKKDVLMIGNHTVDLNKFLPLDREKRVLEKQIADERAIVIDPELPQARREELERQQQTNIAAAESKIAAINLKMFGDQGLRGEQAKRSKGQIEVAGMDVIAKLPAKSLDVDINDPIVSEIITKYKQNPTAAVSLGMLEAFVGSEIDSENGNIIVKDEKTAKFFKDLYAKHREVAIMMYNRAQGINNPNSAEWKVDVPKEVRDNIVVAKEKKDKDGTMHYQYYQYGNAGNDLTNQYVDNNHSKQVRKKKSVLVGNKVVAANQKQYTRAFVQEHGLPPEIIEEHGTNQAPTPEGAPQQQQSRGGRNRGQRNNAQGQGSTNPNPQPNTNAPQQPRPEGSMADINDVRPPEFPASYEDETEE